MKVRVQVRQADGTVRYDREHEATVTEQNVVTLKPYLPAVTNGETISFDRDLRDLPLIEGRG